MQAVPAMKRFTPVTLDNDRDLSRQIFKCPFIHLQADKENYTCFSCSPMCLEQDLLT